MVVEDGVVVSADVVVGSADVVVGDGVVVGAGVVVAVADVEVETGMVVVRMGMLATIVETTGAVEVVAIMSGVVVGGVDVVDVGSDEAAACVDWVAVV